MCWTPVLAGCSCHSNPAQRCYGWHSLSGKSWWWSDTKTLSAKQEGQARGGECWAWSSLVWVMLEPGWLWSICLADLQMTVFAPQGSMAIMPGMGPHQGLDKESDLRAGFPAHVLCCPHHCFIWLPHCLTASP